jgi:hypothetical protein
MFLAFSRRRLLRATEKTLVGVVGAISHNSNRRIRIATKLAFGKLGGFTFASAVLGSISVFGTASTGTAIWTLYGAAATAAQYFWIGSIFGLGMYAGGFVLSILGLVFGIISSYFMYKTVFGMPRDPSKMKDFELAVVLSCSKLIKPLKDANAKQYSPSKGELKVLAHEGLTPIISLISDHLYDLQNTDDLIEPAITFKKTLAIIPRLRLRAYCNRLRKIRRKILS